FLVKTQPGTDRRALAARLRARLPEADVHDQDSYSRKCMAYWLTRTGVGMSFSLAAVLGLLVGLAVVAQTLYASVAERIREFGTLRAMGADDQCVGRFLVAQALGTAAIGSTLGLLGSLVHGGGLSSPRSPVVLTWQVAVLSVAMIVLS